MTAVAEYISRSVEILFSPLETLKMNYSGLILVLCCVLVSPAVGDIMRKIETVGMECIKETGADLAKLMLMVKGQEIEADDKIKCFGACFMKSMGAMSSTGEVDKAAALAMVPEDALSRDKIIAAMTECLDNKGSNDCETAHAIGECLRTNHMVAFLIMTGKGNS